MYLWFEEMGLINQPKETTKERLQYFEEYLNSVSARNKLTRKFANGRLKKRGRAL